MILEVAQTEKRAWNNRPESEESTDESTNDEDDQQNSSETETDEQGMASLEQLVSKINDHDVSSMAGAREFLGTLSDEDPEAIPVSNPSDVLTLTAERADSESDFNIGSLSISQKEDEVEK